MKYTFTTKQGSISFANKLCKIKNKSKRKYLLKKREVKYGVSIWNPGLYLV